MEAAINADPELAIGTAKELVESVAKTILAARGVEVVRKDDLPKIVREATKALSLSRENVADAARAADTIKIVLGNLSSIVNGVAELRNFYGTGHGRTGSSGIQPRHARLVVGAASTLATFLMETHEQRPVP